MSSPRHIVSGRIWFLTRRTVGRHFLLRPDANGISQQIYWYTTAVLAEKFGIVVHAVQVLSTHIHEVVTDTHGNLPAFLRERNRALANALKCHRGWPEEVFQRASASCVELYGTRAVASKIAYTIANCVEAGLVERPEDWPGVTSLVRDIGTRAFRVARPAAYFDPNNPVWPDHAEITMQMPEPLTAAYGARALRILEKIVEGAIQRARILAKKLRGFVASIRNIVSVSPTRRSSSYEKFGEREPHFAAGGDFEEAIRAKTERRTFLSAYREALRSWRTGEARPDFPAGTWRWVRELLGPPAPQIFQRQTDPRTDPRIREPEKA